jgi:hypothetical protein
MMTRVETPETMEPSKMTIFALRIRNENCVVAAAENETCSYPAPCFRTGSSFRKTSNRKPIEHVEVLGCLNHECSCDG